MHIVFALFGTRGDIQPGVTLGLELQRRGHSVVVTAPSNLMEFVTKSGLEAGLIDVDVTTLLLSPEGQRFHEGNTFTLASRRAEMLETCADIIDDGLIKHSRGADVIVGNTLTEDRVYCLSEAFGTSQVIFHPFIYRENSLSLPPGRPLWGQRMPRWVNRAAWWHHEAFRARATRSTLTSFREKLGLPQSTASTESLFAKADAPEVQIYDKLLVPGLAEEWGPRRPLVGFLQLPQSAREAVGELSGSHADVVAWAQAGSPPVYFGFGSMPVLNFDETLRIIREVCGRLGQRALVSAGEAHVSSAASTEGKDVKLVGALAHDTIFPYCRAAVHHGGIGTLFESLRAGLPTLICSVSFNQPFWGDQIERLGVGAHAPYWKLNARRLEAGLRTVLSPETTARAEEFGKLLRESPDGVPATCDIIENVARPSALSSQ